MSTGPKPIGGGLAAWSIGHPIGVVMLTLALMVLGLFSLGRLGVDLLPHIIYPEVRVRIVDPGVPASIMEDQITRQLEEQLAITEDAVHVRSETTEGALRGGPGLRIRQGHRYRPARRQHPPGPGQTIPARHHRPAGDLQARSLPAPGGGIRGQLRPARPGGPAHLGRLHPGTLAAQPAGGRGGRGGRRSGARDPGAGRPATPGGPGHGRARPGRDPGTRQRRHPGRAPADARRRDQRPHRRALHQRRADHRPAPARRRQRRPGGASGGSRPGGGRGRGRTTARSPQRSARHQAVDPETAPGQYGDRGGGGQPPARGAGGGRPDPGRHPDPPGGRPGHLYPQRPAQCGAGGAQRRRAGDAGGIPVPGQPAAHPDHRQLRSRSPCCSPSS